MHADKGDIACEIMVNNWDYRVNEVGAMIGMEHPVMSMAHQYLLTDTIPAIRDAGCRCCPARSATIPARKKTGSFAWILRAGLQDLGMDGIDPQFTNALCSDDLDRVTDVLEKAFARMPALEEAGVTTIVNGPITYTINGAPLAEGDGHGWLLAQQIMHGEACYDTWGSIRAGSGRIARSN